MHDCPFDPALRLLFIYKDEKGIDLVYIQVLVYSAYSLVGFWAGLGLLMLVYCERKTLLADWFWLAETNKQTD